MNIRTDKLNMFIMVGDLNNVNNNNISRNSSLNSKII